MYVAKLSFLLLLSLKIYHSYDLQQQSDYGSCIIHHSEKLKTIPRSEYMHVVTLKIACVVF